MKAFGGVTFMEMTLLVSASCSVVPRSALLIQSQEKKPTKMRTMDGGEKVVISF